MNLYARGGKRVLDVVLATIALVSTAPLLLIAATLVKLTSRGPMLFHQERLGRDGRTFGVVKLRTMTDGARTPAAEVAADDAEVTAVGRLLRRTKIDELPQLATVIAGDMSLIGPRPALPTQLGELDDISVRRLAVRPGLTGLAQVNGNIELSWPERWRYDVWYVDHLSLRLDLRIFVATVSVIVLGESRRARRMELPS